MVVHEEVTTKEKINIRLTKLEALDKDGLAIQQNPELYHHRMPKALNKQVRLWSFQKGDLVLAIQTAIMIGNKNGKLVSNW